MSASATVPTSNRWPTYVAWALQVLLALAFLAAGLLKLAGAAPMVQIFDQIGFGQWFRIVTALVEIVGAVGLVVPGFAGPAGLWLGFEMVCAITIHLTVLYTNPTPAVVLFALSGVVAYIRRQQISALLAPRSAAPLVQSASVAAGPDRGLPESHVPAARTLTPPASLNKREHSMTLLHIDTSILGDGSVSRELSALIVKRLVGSSGATVTYRDLTAENVPHLTLASLPSAHPAAKMAGTLDAAAQAIRDQSDRMLDEFMAADTVVIGVPMYNFTVPTQLKAWIDRIVIPGKTFQYGANGPEGLAKGKRVYVAIARGGFYGAKTATVSAEHAESLMRTTLGFIGITDPQFILAEGLAAGEANKTKALASAREAVEQLAA